MPTPHITASDQDVAKVVIMPGDPLRAKFIAEKYLKDIKQINSIRNMLMFTGTYNGKRVTVAGSGMGMPSIGIYAFELFNYYGAETIIRVGSSGSFKEDLKIYEVVLATESYSTSTFAESMINEKVNVLYPSSETNKIILNAAKTLNIPIKQERIESEDVFYNIHPLEKRIKDSGAACVEMESFALFAVAKRLNKNAACLLTISDNLVTHEETTAEERQSSFTKMMEVALKAVEELT